MKKLYLIAAAAMTLACSAKGEFSEGAEADKDRTALLCKFDFYSTAGCTVKIDQQVLTVSLEGHLIADDEKELTHLIVNRDQETLRLPISSGVSLIEGDIGYILFDDINFDQRPDVAVSTSFGTPNWYLDYWTAAEHAKEFNYVGNFPRLHADEASRTLSTEERVNAASYQTTTWRWEDGQLVIQDSERQSPK